MGFVSKFKKQTVAQEDEDILDSSVPDGVVSVKETENSQIFYLSGKIDVTTAEEIQSRIMNEIGRLPVVLNAKDVTHLSSAGMRMLYELKKHCSALGLPIEVCDIPHSIYRLLDMTGYPAIVTLKELETNF